MFKVTLKNVGRDMVNRDFVVHSNDMNEVVAKTFKACGDILGRYNEFRFKVEDEEINIVVHTIVVGSVTITKFN